MREITKEDWEANIEKNEILIRQNLMQIEMAKEVIKLCKRKIAEFPKEKEKEKPLNNRKPKN